MECKPFQFLTKPLIKSEIQRQFELALTFTLRRKRRVCIEYKDAIVALNPDELIRVEARGRYLDYYTTNGDDKTAQYHALGKIAEAEKSLQDLGFIRIHRCTLLNASKIRQVHKSSIECVSGCVLPMSSRRRGVLIMERGHFLSIQIICRCGKL